MSKQTTQSKHWVFTINNWTIHDIELISKQMDQYTYLITGKEGKDTNTPHIQGYVVFKQPKRLTQISKIMPRAWIKKKYTKSTPKQSSDYCKKEHDYYEYGTIPLTKEQAKKQVWTNAYQDAKQGNYDKIPHGMLIRYYHAFKRIHQDNPIKPKDLHKLENVWIYAPSDYGKSTYAREKYPDYYDKPPNKWFIGYKGQQTLLLDDYGPEQIKYITWYLKRWSDKFSFPMETKGGGRQIRPKHIIITSQYSIDECMPDWQTSEAIHRRFKVKHLKPYAVRNLKKHKKMMHPVLILINPELNYDI